MKLNKKGFTLIELMVAIAVIALLAVIILISLNSARDATEDSKRAAVINQIRSFSEVSLTQSINLNYETLSMPGDGLIKLIEEYGVDGDFTETIDDSKSKKVLRINVPLTAPGAGDPWPRQYGWYCAQIQLKSKDDDYYCVDHNLVVKKNTSSHGNGPCFNSTNDNLYECTF